MSEQPYFPQTSTAFGNTHVFLTMTQQRILFCELPSTRAIKFSVPLTLTAVITKSSNYRSDLMIASLEYRVQWCHYFTSQHSSGDIGMNVDYFVETLTEITAFTHTEGSTVKSAPLF